MVEGEKDVHAIEWADPDAVAVTSPQGAKSAHKFDWSVLKGKDINIVGDRDKEGRGYVDAVVKQLNGSAASITLMQARVGKDAADHIAAGLGLDDFDDYAPEESVPAADSDYPDDDDDAPQLDLPNDLYGKKFKCPAPSAPFDVARKLYRPFRANNGRTLLAWRGGWMRWHITHWSELDTAQLRSHIYYCLQNAFYITKDKDGNEIRRPWNPDQPESGQRDGSRGKRSRTYRWTSTRRHGSYIARRKPTAATDDLMHQRDTRPVWPPARRPHARPVQPRLGAVRLPG